MIPYRAINFETDLQSIGSFHILEPGDATRYYFSLREIPNGVMGWGRDVPLYEVVLYHSGGSYGTTLVFQDYGATIDCMEFRYPDDPMLSYACTRRAMLAFINHMLDRENPYAGPFTGDRTVDGFLV